MENQRREIYRVKHDFFSVTKNIKRTHKTQARQTYVCLACLFTNVGLLDVQDYDTFFSTTRRADNGWSEFVT